MKNTMNREEFSRIQAVQGNDILRYIVSKLYCIFLHQKTNMTAAVTSIRERTIARARHHNSAVVSVLLDSNQTFAVTRHDLSFLISNRYFEIR